MKCGIGYLPRIKPLEMPKIVEAIKHMEIDPIYYVHKEG